VTSARSAAIQPRSASAGMYGKVALAGAIVEMLGISTGG
jgi:hypothetical protein